MAAKKRRRGKSKFKAKVLSRKMVHVLIETHQGDAHPWRSVSSFPSLTDAKKFKQDIESE